MNYLELDTPSLLIDEAIMMQNIVSMQDYANKSKVSLRPHTKTHKMPYIAKVQQKQGCKGITVAKVSEALVMAEEGINDIFIANQIVGKIKLEKIKKLGESIDISFGLDSIENLMQINELFSDSDKPANVLIEIEVGEERSGVILEEDFIELLATIKKCENVKFKGVFSHEGHCYNASSKEDCLEKFNVSQARTLKFAEIARQEGLGPQVVSIGSTPSLIQDFPIMEGVTEIRPGTYVFMDASMTSIPGSAYNCAATVLTTVISRPTSERVITDVGAKGITAQKRNIGITATKGMGKIKNHKDVSINDVFDEHAIIYNKEFRDAVSIGDKVEIIPVHICPVCNLHDIAYLVKNGKVVEEIPVLCRGKLK